MVLKSQCLRKSPIEKNLSLSYDFSSCFSESLLNSEYTPKFLEISDVRNSLEGVEGEKIASI